MRPERVDIWQEEQSGAGEISEMRIGDVRALLPGLLSQYAGQAQVIYMDPPFGTGQVFSMRVRVGEKEWRSGVGSLEKQAYDDQMGLEDYLALIRDALIGARDLLCDTGVVFLHVDFRMHARLRLIMDEVFGEANFLNEIIWSYQSGGRARRFFSRKHDVILFYRKTKKYYFNLEAVPISRTDTRHNHMKRHVDADGRVYRSIRSGGKIYTYYDDEPAYPGDVWDDVSHLQQKDPQRTGYDTQKPIRLLERIILSCSKPGDLVMDLFAGSGTTLEAAYLSGRRFVGVDVSPYALQVSRRRLIGANVRYSAPPSQGNPEVELSIVPAIAYYEVTLEKYQLESGLIASSLTGLDAVDGWSAGYLRDGVFVAMTHDNRSRHQPRLKGVLQLPVLSGVPCVRVTDVMGRVFYYIIKPEEV